MEKPEKNTFTDSSWDGAIDAYEKFLPDEKEIREIVLSESRGILGYGTAASRITKAIATRIGR